MDYYFSFSLSFFFFLLCLFYLILHLAYSFFLKDISIIDEAISFSQAALGDVIGVPTIDGELKLKVQPGTQSGTLIRLRGQGMPHLQSRGRGDQYVRLIIKVPDRLSRRQRQLLEEFEMEN